MKRTARRIGEGVWFWAGTALLFALWEVAARLNGSALLLPGPGAVAGRFALLLRQAGFYRSLLASFLRVLASLAVAVPLGFGAGLLAGLDRRCGALLRPLFTVVSATPVLAIILIAFLWFGSEQTPVFTGFLMVFPVMAATTTEGLRGIDPKLREVFTLYRIPFGEKLRALYLPSLLPVILGGLRSALSLCWKVVAAAEVLVQPAAGLGTGMQRAKANLETGDLFAWTVATIAAAGLMQGALSALTREKHENRH